MNRHADTFTIKVDGKALEVERGLTVLEVARRHDIYIPTLCAYKDLTPFGACRMCVVEVNGMRGFPAACTTPVYEGMEVTTNSTKLHEARVEVLQLILSEHPSTCMICDERVDCGDILGTIRKAGVTTGCRYCPSDGECELQDLVKKLGVTELDYPVRYHGRRVEREDPFMDRDYNLCILCGRCVRVCQEVRGTGTLAFRQRGPDTVVGTAYGRSHMDAGCEFCGACVAVCPTGALSEKARKWEGVAEREEISTCPLCGLGCQLRLLVKGDKVIGSLPADDPLVNNGQLCVKGRFCLPELVDHHKRLTTPYVVSETGRVETTWDDAVGLAAEKLDRCDGDEFSMVVSANCTNEDLYVAQKFARAVMGSNNIDTDARAFYGDGFDAYLKLLKKSGTLSEVQNASAILCVGLDSRFAQSIVNIEIKKAMDRGARLVTINPREHNLTLVADVWLKSGPGKEIDILERLSWSVGAKAGTATGKRARKRQKGISAAALPKATEILRKADPVMIVVGTDVVKSESAPVMLEAIEKLAEIVDARVLLIPAQNNLVGSLLMGAYPELLPDGSSSADTVKTGEIGTKWGVDLRDVCRPRDGEVSRSRPKVVYWVGSLPANGGTRTEFSIFQNIYSADIGSRTGLVLPSAAFSEVDGTFVSGERRIQAVKKTVEPPGEALPDWEILCRIARKMGKGGFDFKSVDDIREEIAGLVDTFRERDTDRRDAIPLECDELTVTADPAPSNRPERRKIKRRSKAYPFLLSTTVAEHTYKGFFIGDFVEGGRAIFAEGVVDISPTDAERAD
ncbi:MAG: molybdopterin-dependent oxidoreductase, partial [Candidatus Latescibacterota bacterium]